ncbi:MAG: hypothetical protein AB9897_00520 [Anaerolineaceae bacterium]
MFDLNIYPYPVTEKLSAPGLMIFPPTGKTARGKENNLLIVYFTLLGQTGITLAGLRTWMEKKAQTFYSNPGTVTAGMREFIDSVNNDLFERNTRPDKKTEQVTINLMLAVLKREMLYLANCGSGQGYFIGKESNLQLREADSSGRALGVSRPVTVRFTQSILTNNDLLLFTFNPPEHWNQELMAGGEALSVDAFARRLFNNPGNNGKGVLMRFGEGSGKVNYNRLSQIQSPQLSAEENHPAEENGEIIEAPIEKTPVLPNENRPDPIQTGEPKPAFRQSEGELAPKPIQNSTPNKTPGFQTDGVKNAVGDLLRGGAKTKRQVGAWIKDLTQKILPGDPEKPTHFSRGLLIFIAIAIPVIIVAIATTFYVRNGKNNLFDQYLAEAQGLAQRADSQLGDNASRLASLQESLYWLDKADAYGKSEDSISLRNKLQSGVDSLEGIIRVDMSSALNDVLLPGVNLTQMVATNTDLYVLDNNSGKILRFTLSGSAYVQDSKFDCGPNPENPLNNIGNLVDMVTISPENSYKATLLAVDAAGTLDYCVPSDSGYVTKLPSPDLGWGAIQSIALYANYLYVLDGKDNAVYRFKGAGIDFNENPTLFFDEVIPPLSDALDIEEIGYELYILRANGQMIECTYSPIKDMKSTECQVPAPFLDTRAGQTLSVGSFPEAQFVQMRMTEAPDSSLYLLDAKNDTIYHFSYLRSLQRVLHPRMIDGTDSSTLIPTAFAVSPSRVLFVAYGNQIYFGQIP